MRFTREGFRFILAIILIGFASFNTANNLIYLIFSVMVSAFILSVFLTFINTMGIEIEISTPNDLFVKQPSEFFITVRNKKFIPSYSIHIEIDKIGEIYIDYAGKKIINKRLILTPFKRGITEGEFILRTGFPFIFTELKKKIVTNKRFIIYPEIIEITEEIHSPGAEVSSKIKRDGDEFIRIRKYRYGDEKRMIDWKATAKKDELMVREYALIDKSDTITIIFDNYLPSDNKSFERSISFAASLVEFFIRRGFYVRFVTCHKTIPYGSGMEHLYTILDILAIIEPAEDTECMIKDLRDGIMILQSDSSPLMRFKTDVQRLIYASEL